MYPKLLFLKLNIYYIIYSNIIFNCYEIYYIIKEFDVIKNNLNFFQIYFNFYKKKLNFNNIIIKI